MDYLSFVPKLSRPPHLEQITVRGTCRFICMGYSEFTSAGGSKKAMGIFTGSAAPKVENTIGKWCPIVR